MGIPVFLPLFVGSDLPLLGVFWSILDNFRHNLKNDSFVGQGFPERPELYYQLTVSVSSS